MIADGSVEHHRVIKIIVLSTVWTAFYHTDAVLFYRLAPLALSVKVEKIQYVKCHMMGRTLCERRSVSALRVSLPLLRKMDSGFLCAVFLLQKLLQSRIGPDPRGSHAAFIMPAGTN